MPKEAQLRKDLILAASFDFYFLQSRHYTRERSLELVGNRYDLAAMERNVLRRGIFGQKEALERRSKRVTTAELKKHNLTVDGHNVHITVESILLGRTTVKGNDGVIRDIAGVSSSFKLTEASFFAAEMVCRFLAELEIRKAVIYFDAPISRSGELARIYKELFNKYGIRGETQVVPVPERQFPYEESVIASSDSAVIDCARVWIDLAFLVTSAEKPFEPFMDFSFLNKIWQIPDFS
jgi:hypothetical protein